MIPDPSLRRDQAVRAARLHGPVDHGAVALAGPIRLTKGRTHELTGDSADMFALAAAARGQGPVVWVGGAREIAALAPTGLQAFLDPARIILVTGLHRTEQLWAAEQALRARCAPTVILELREGPGLKESRRLQIAAEESGAIGLVLIRGRAQTSAAETRWRCEARPEGGWAWTCLKNKRGPASSWQATWTGNDNAPRARPLAEAASA
ncbi:ImuA family protein (plasmid) [Glycocaulis abyssi]|uniref:ImuA family protein n=1 Tax=Glycocaulis abyssi TaxID=1433403 RepID=A0ABV9NHP8_9PROT